MRKKIALVSQGIAGRPPKKASTPRFCVELPAPKPYVLEVSDLSVVPKAPTESALKTPSSSVSPDSGLSASETESSSVTPPSVSSPSSQRNVTPTLLQAVRKLERTISHGFPLEISQTQTNQSMGLERSVSEDPAQFLEDETARRTSEPLFQRAQRIIEDRFDPKTFVRQPTDIERVKASGTQGEVSFITDAKGTVTVCKSYFYGDRDVKTTKNDAIITAKYEARCLEMLYVGGHSPHYNSPQYLGYSDTDEEVKLYISKLDLPQNSTKPTPQHLYRSLKMLEDFNSRGIVHGDLSETNLLLGDNDRVDVLDFGASLIKEISRAKVDKPGVQVTYTRGYTHPDLVASSQLETVVMRNDFDRWSLASVLTKGLFGESAAKIFGGIDLRGKDEDMAALLHQLGMQQYGSYFETHFLSPLQAAFEIPQGTSVVDTIKKLCEISPTDAVQKLTSFKTNTQVPITDAKQKLLYVLLGLMSTNETIPPHVQGCFIQLCEKWFPQI